jgi:hypothetical protein
MVVSIETGERTKNVYAGTQIIPLDKEKLFDSRH